MTPQNGNQHLGDTLKDLNTAIEEWDKITNKPQTEQVVSKDSLEKRTKELLMQLRDQIHSLSKDADEVETEEAQTAKEALAAATPSLSAEEPSEALVETAPESESPRIEAPSQDSAPTAPPASSDTDSSF